MVMTGVTLACAPFVGQIGRGDCDDRNLRVLEFRRFVSVDGAIVRSNLPDERKRSPDGGQGGEFVDGQGLAASCRVDACGLEVRG